MTTAAHGDWLPPESPDPSAILTEAQADAAAKRYADALAKHLWFHHNALKHRPSLYGVRLSFALGYWLELGKQYPRAIQALKEVRDETGIRIRQGKANHSDVHDFASINEVLSEEHITAELFVCLDKNDPNLAKQSYDVVENSLIQAKQYRLCGKYIDSEASVDQILGLYREHQQMAKDPRFGPDLKDFANKALSHGAGTLVALLVLNDRIAEADQVIAAVLNVRSDAALKKRLYAARKGVLPEAWPPRGS